MLPADPDRVAVRLAGARRGASGRVGVVGMSSVPSAERQRWHVIKNLIVKGRMMRTTVAVRNPWAAPGRSDS